MKVLFLSAWYPQRNDTMSGLFVQKHAEAVGELADVQVLFVCPDNKIKKIEIVVQQHKNIKETIVYFPKGKNDIFSKLLKQLNYIRAYFIGWSLVRSSGFKPHLIHVNILTRTGVIAYCIKKQTKIPYIITEHWSRYLPIRNSYSGIFRKIITKFIVKNAEAVLPVSNNLKNAMISHRLLNKNYKVVNNTVSNCFLESPVLTERKTKRILHISCFDEKAKNIKGILNVIEKLSLVRTDFELKLIGDGIDFELIFNYSKQLKIPEGLISFTGEKTPEEVAIEMYNADLLLLFSNYENSPVVISESLICGKPVLSTNVGGISEHVDASNGILVERNDENALLGALNLMLDNIERYDSNLIRENAIEKFSCKSIGQKLFHIYNEVLTEYRYTLPK